MHFESQVHSWSREGYTSFVEFPVHPVPLLEGAKTGIIVVNQLIEVVHGRDWG